MPKKPFSDVLLSLCAEKGITAADAFDKATPYLNPKSMANKVMGGYVPDLTTIEALSKFFGTGVDTFLPGHTVEDRNRVCFIAGSVDESDESLGRFSDAKAYMESHGRKVVSMAAVASVLPYESLKARGPMDVVSMQLLSMCEELVLLPDWGTDVIARMQKEYADAAGLPVVELRDGHIRDGERIRVRQVVDDLRGF